MLFNQHDFIAPLCISLISQDYFRNTISEIVPIMSLHYVAYLIFRILRHFYVAKNVACL